MSDAVIFNFPYFVIFLTLLAAYRAIWSGVVHLILRGAKEPSFVTAWTNTEEVIKGGLLCIKCGFEGVQWYKSQIDYASISFYNTAKQVHDDLGAPPEIAEASVHSAYVATITGLCGVTYWIFGW